MKIRFLGIFSRKSDSTTTNVRSFVRSFVCPSVCQLPKPPNSLKSIIPPYHHPQHNIHHHIHHYLQCSIQQLLSFLAWSVAIRKISTLQPFSSPTLFQKWTLVIIELLLRQNNLLKHFKLIFLRTSTLMVTQKHITHHNSSHRGPEQEGGLMN